MTMTTLFETSLNQSPAAVMIVDIHGNIQYVNAAFSRLCGYSSEEVIGKNPRFLKSGDMPKGVYQKLWETLLAGSTWTGEFHNRRKDGTTYWESASVTPVRDDSGSITHFIAFKNEITKHSEDDSREAANRLRMTFNTMSEGVALNEIIFDDHGDMIDYRIIDVNAAFYNTADFTGKSVIGNTATALYGMSTESIRAFWQSHKSATTVSHTEMVSPLHQRHFLISVSPFAGNRFVTSFLDITERKRIEAEHTRALELLRTIADNVPAMIAYWTRDLRCAFANRAYEGWFGRKPDEMIGSSLDQILGPELYAKNKPYVERALAGEPQQFERTLIKPNGEIGYTWAQYVPHVHDGEVQGMIVLISDITEPRKAESRKRELEAELVQARKLESLGTLAGGVAHDFNNILGIILGHASLLKMSVKEPELTERLSTIENAAMRGGALVNQLLTFARKSETSLSLVSVNDTVRETVKLLSATFPRNIEISVQLSENLPSVMGNATQIQQALMNLCTNARDAMPDGGNLTISAKIADPSIIAAEFPKAHFSDFLLIEVKDTGVGMDTETKRRIFEPFFTTKGPGRGTGLGLSVAYSILKEHRGLFVVDSEPGQGSTFRIYLPIESNTTTATGLTIETDRSGKDTILIIADEQMLRASLEETLVTQGYKVFTAVNGEQGVEVFQQHKDDITVVICDLGLPGLSGHEVIKKIHANRPGTRIIATSGFMDSEALQKLNQSGNPHILHKPYRLAELISAVRSEVNGI